MEETAKRESIYNVPADCSPYSPSSCRGEQTGRKVPHFSSWNTNTTGRCYSGGACRQTPVLCPPPLHTRIRHTTVRSNRTISSRSCAPTPPLPPTASHLPPYLLVLSATCQKQFQAKCQLKFSNQHLKTLSEKRLFCKDICLRTTLFTLICFCISFMKP